MKDGITLHPEHGLNPSIEVCMICGEEMGIALLGNNIKGQAPHHICTGEVCDNCKKIIDEGGCFIIEVEDGSDQKNLIERKSDSGYDVTILLNMYLTLAFVKEFGFKAGEAWSEITEYAYGCLSYSDFATTEMLIPEGSEHLFKDIYTAKADELYHHVLDKFGWAWRDPKYKSETELCSMLKWAKEKGLTIEELSI